MNNNSLDVIKYVGDNNVLVAKSHIENFNTKSQLIVNESQEALFYKDGQALDLFLSGRHSLNTDNLPFFKKLFGKIYITKRLLYENNELVGQYVENLIDLINDIH